MSENIEFISAADLPTTEAEEVDVLCVENGELKRKAGATLGGGGGGSYKVVLTPENFGESDGIAMCTDNYDELAKALESDLDVSIIMSAELTEEVGISMRVVSWTFMEGMGVVCVVFNPMSSEPMLIGFPNGTYVPTI